MLDFLRPDLADLAAYTPHPSGDTPTGPLDRLDTNESPYDLSGSLKGKLSQIYQDEIENNRYPDGSHHDLKTAIAAYANESCSSIANGTAAAITADRVSVGNGSDELIRALLIATCLGDRGRILVATPTFSMYGILAQTLGIPVETIGRNPDTFEIDIDAARLAIAAPHEVPIRVVWVVHPNSPTANALTSQELSWLRGLPKGVLVVIDEAYFEFSQQTVVGELAARPNWLVLRTFSKAFRLAAHRVGYAIGHPDAIAVLEKVRLPYNLPSFSQVAATVALACRRDLLGSVSETIQERQRLLQELSAMPRLRTWQSQANFIYCRLLRDNNPDEAMANLCAALKQQGTLVRHTGGGLRFTVGSPQENQRTVERLRSLLTN